MESHSIAIIEMSGTQVTRPATEDRWDLEGRAIFMPFVWSGTPIWPTALWSCMASHTWGLAVDYAFNCFHEAWWARRAEQQQRLRHFSAFVLPSHASPTSAGAATCSLFKSPHLVCFFLRQTRHYDTDSSGTGHDDDAWGPLTPGSHFCRLVQQEIERPTNRAW